MRMKCNFLEYHSARPHSAEAVNIWWLCTENEERNWKILNLNNFIWMQAGWRTLSFVPDEFSRLFGNVFIKYFVCWINNLSIRISLFFPFPFVIFPFSICTQPDRPTHFPLPHCHSQHSNVQIVEMWYRQVQYVILVPLLLLSARKEWWVFHKFDAIMPNVNEAELFVWWYKCFSMHFHSHFPPDNQMMAGCSEREWLAHWLRSIGHW